MARVLKLLPFDRISHILIAVFMVFCRSYNKYLANMATASTAVKTTPKCKYWDKCFRTEPSHMKNYRHPNDGDKNKKKADVEEIDLEVS